MPLLEVTVKALVEVDEAWNPRDASNMAGVVTRFLTPRGCGDWNGPQSFSWGASLAHIIHLRPGEAVALEPKKE
jgi:hypothetical protein